MRFARQAAAEVGRFVVGGEAERNERAAFGLLFHDHAPLAAFGGLAVIHLQAHLRVFGVGEARVAGVVGHEAGLRQRRCRNRLAPAAVHRHELGGRHDPFGILEVVGAADEQVLGITGDRSDDFDHFRISRAAAIDQGLLPGTVRVHGKEFAGIDRNVHPVAERLTQVVDHAIADPPELAQFIFLEWAEVDTFLRPLPPATARACL
ncbi:hypothetical protein PEC18_34965 [Paucibacter sp. O1-1]|nr:hypothetical protein [Paucibacter sp. O1-1]MDA3830878.1 hypothetical protein [Paucibacter sp. O1-1]